MRSRLVAGNWKMHGGRAANRALLDSVHTLDSIPVFGQETRSKAQPAKAKTACCASTEA